MSSPNRNNRRTNSPGKRPNTSGADLSYQSIQKDMSRSHAGMESVDTANGRKAKGLSIRQVEIDHLKTSIIALHEEFKVVEDERRDADNKREKESLHLKQGGIVSVFLDNSL